MFTLAHDSIEPIKRVCKIAATKSPVQSLECVLIKADKDTNTITLKAGDSSVEISLTIPAEVESSLSTLINASKFAQCVQACNGGKVTLKSDSLNIKSGRRRFNIQTLDPEAYPEFPEFGDNEKLDISASELTSAIRSVQFAAAKNDVRFVFNGVYIGNNCAATNGHRIAILENFSIDKEAIISVDCLNKMPDIEGDAYLSASNLTIKNKDECFRMRLVDGKYPDIAMTIPKSDPDVVTVDREHMIESLKAAMISAPTDSKNVLLSFGKKCKIIAKSGRSDDADIGFDADCQSDIEMGFNSSYLIDALSVLQSESVQLQIADGKMMINEEGLTQIIAKVTI